MPPLPFLPKGSVKVTLEQDMIFVHPSSSASGPSEDPMVIGTVILSLQKRSAVKTIRVVLHGLCDAYGGLDWPYESSATLEKKLEIALKDEVMEAGDHAFDFSFIIPSSTAVFQRSSYGRVRHYVKAYADFTSSMRSNLISPSVALWLTASPAPSGSLLEPVEIDLQHFHEDLGIIQISISSLHLTVSSLLHTRVDFHGSSQPFTISSISGSIMQSFSVHYTQCPGVARPPERRHNLIKIDDSPASELPTPPIAPVTRTRSRRNSSFSGGAPLSQMQSNASSLGGTTPSERVRVDPVPLVTLAPEQTFNYSCVMRVPNDDIIRPTTLKHTDTKIRVSHSLVFRVSYIRAEDGKEMEVSFGKDVTIASCCCLIDSLALPAYAKVAPCTKVDRANRRCLCNMSLEEMFDRDGFALERAAPSASTQQDVRAFAPDRDSKTPVTWVDVNDQFGRERYTA